jgi:hypothetical protein
MLIDTMEKVARPEVRALPNDQLARPVSPYRYNASAFSLRN